MHYIGSLLEQTPSSSRLAAPTLARYSRKFIGWKTAVRPTMFPSFTGCDSDQDRSLASAARPGNTRSVRVRAKTSNPWPRGVPIGAAGARESLWPAISGRTACVLLGARSHLFWLAVGAGSVGACTGGRPLVSDPAPEDLEVSLDAGTDTDITDVETVDAGCAESTVRGELKPSHLLFVLDRSGSMACNLPSDGQSSQACSQFPTRRYPDLASKWELTVKALKQAVDELAGVENVEVGLSLFPREGTSCTVSTTPDLPIVALDPDQQDALSATLDSLQPSGETPLSGALILSYAYLLEQLRSGAFDEGTFVVVLTDGFETCKPDEVSKLLEVDMPAARDRVGVRTFVVGAPGSEDSRALLSKMAVAGGTERSRDCFYDLGAAEGDCHYDMTQSVDFAAELLTVLRRINSEALSCTVKVPEADQGGAVDLEKVNVQVDGQSWPMQREGSCAEVDGWRYSEDYRSIHLCGAACAAARGPSAEVRVILGCPTAIR